jgi:leucyl aminopeptidase
MLIHYAATVPAEFSGALAVVAAKDAPLSGAALALDGVTGGQIARAIAAARFDGDAASIVEIFAPASSPATRILVVGLGKADAADAAAFEKIGGAIAARLIT